MTYYKSPRENSNNSPGHFQHKYTNIPSDRAQVISLILIIALITVLCMVV